MTSLPRPRADGSPRRRLLQAVRRAQATLLAGVAMIGLGIGGCAAPVAKIAAVETPAVVVVENHTDYAWRIAFTPEKAVSGGGTTTIEWQKLAPREIRRVELAGGVYAVRRALGNGDTEASPPRTGKSN